MLTPSKFHSVYINKIDKLDEEIYLITQNSILFILIEFKAIVLSIVFVPQNSILFILIVECLP